MNKEKYLRNNLPDEPTYVFTEDELNDFIRRECIEFGRWKQQSRYELIPSDYADFMEWKNNQTPKQ